MPIHIAPPIRRIEQAREDAGINTKQNSTAFNLLYTLEKAGKKALTVFPSNRSSLFIRNFPFTWEPNVAKESEGLTGGDLSFTDAIRQPPFLSIKITGEQMVMAGDLKNRWLRVSDQFSIADAVAHT